MSSSQHGLKEKGELDKKIAEQKVLENELSSLKKGARGYVRKKEQANRLNLHVRHVYKQQQNSNIFFLSSVPKEMACAKQNLNNLVREYQKMEVEIQRETTGGQ